MKMPLTKEQIVNRVAVRAAALIVMDFPAPQCAVKKQAWDKEVKEIRRLVAERLLGPSPDTRSQTTGI